MIERYFTFKLICVAIVFGFIGVAVLVLITISVIQDIRWNRKIKLLEKKGFKKYLRGVPSVGDGAFYGWKRESDGKQIHDTCIKSRSYKELKEWIEEEK